ncbi:SagB/ThcOx family dehydrogenase [Liquorilactobacillus oeni]|uniref:Nitroreductase domain-containing protein n=1 Tax=Liquorilactobacillus oeni DSM 19972 TaxID=1423777 RepID=A0A0R1MEV0_9LACO|nr:SagB/ThcOx family dehydrogenase [Liquorilactobacillus oeni]KRL06622.1 hypothetical protein FD46_GL000294 [Liquorilactobacillus oeni DSM 19972]
MVGKFFSSNNNIVDFFHANTSLNDINISSLQGRINHTLIDPDFKKNCFAVNAIYRRYRNKSIKLYPLEEMTVNKNGLFECLMKRRTNSNLPKIKTPLGFAIFSQIVRYSFGISNVSEGLVSQSKCFQYTYPTEGGLNTLEIYIVVNSVSKVPCGVYLFNPYNNTLETVRDRFRLSEYEHITGLVKQAKNSFFSVYMVGNGKYSFSKYGDRSYRFMNIEAGHSSQNLYLTTTACGLECAASGAFFDDDFFSFLDIPSENRYLLYENFVGI